MTSDEKKTLKKIIKTIVQIYGGQHPVKKIPSRATCNNVLDSLSYANLKVKVWMQLIFCKRPE
ncbi:MAG: hypothetical protein A3F43_00665 [Gammaproteobacteria bacterium RIFCSPHIGHO2_12_FULL_42_10]|nr:MAG: hypothetical protein A3F43_00665 [Gammaproteobacteria bacterium RIFCSPHIGHO2_12_FULL_42_10]